MRFSLGSICLLLVAVGTAKAAVGAVTATPTPAPADVLYDRLLSEKPFWQDNPKLEKRLRDERAILASARSRDGWIDPKLVLFTMNSVGVVRREQATTFKMAQEFDRLKEVSSHFREVRWDAKSQRLFLIAEALGYQARMLMQLTILAPDRIRLRVIDGEFTGLTGLLQFKPLSVKETEVSIRAAHEAKELPLPRFLMGFALEVVVQKVAEKMRRHFESKEPKVDAISSSLVPSVPAGK